MADRLGVWLYDTRVATIEREQNRLSLRYTKEALASFPLGSPLLSTRLVLSSRPFEDREVRPFLDGLLPEEGQRRLVAEVQRLLADDTFGLIRALGRDCAGAIVIVPDEETAAPPSTTLTAIPLSEEDLLRLVANLRTAPLGLGDGVRLSLAGVQEKLLLTRLPDGRWARPVEGTPSTHILKPPLDAQYPHSVENELFCMRLAGHLGLRVAQVETLEVGGRMMLLVERYDRVVHDDGRVERVHQEDLCQALGYPPRHKYEDDHGPSLTEVARALERVARREDVETLLRATVLNLLVGNGDAHGKNFSLLHGTDGSIRLAPLYDLMSSAIYGDTTLAMKIDGEARMDRVAMPHLLDEAARWGIRGARAAEIIRDLLGQAPAAIVRAAMGAPAGPPALRPYAEERLERLRSQPGS